MRPTSSVPISGYCHLSRSVNVRVVNIRPLGCPWFLAMVLKILATRRFEVLVVFFMKYGTEFITASLRLFIAFWIALLFFLPDKVAAVEIAESKKIWSSIQQPESFRAHGDQHHSSQIQNWIVDRIEISFAQICWICWLLLSRLRWEIYFEVIWTGKFSESLQRLKC